MKFDILLENACDIITIKESVSASEYNSFRKKLNNFFEEFEKLNKEARKAKENIKENKKVKTKLDTLIGRFEQFISSMDASDVVDEESGEVKKDTLKDIEKVLKICGATVAILGIIHDNEDAKAAGTGAILASIATKWMRKYTETKNKKVDISELKSACKETLQSMKEKSKELDKYLNNAENITETKESANNIKLSVYESERSGDITAEQREILLEMLNTV